MKNFADDKMLMHWIYIIMRNMEFFFFWQICTVQEITIIFFSLLSLFYIGTYWNSDKIVKWVFLFFFFEKFVFFYGILHPIRKVYRKYLSNTSIYTQESNFHSRKTAKLRIESILKLIIQIIHPFKSFFHFFRPIRKMPSKYLPNTSIYNQKSYFYPMVWTTNCH